MNCYTILAVSIILLHVWITVGAVKWLSLAKVSVVDHIMDQEGCDGLSGLVKRQQNLCRKNVELMEAVKSGAVEAILECQSQFRGRRWNCSTVNKPSIFGKIMSTGTREAAFIHGISSAGVGHSVTTACSSGMLKQCGCDRTVAQQVQGSPALAASDFEWAGCSDNVAYGNAFSRAFVDARERVKGAGANRALMNLHNNNAGRKVLEDLIRVQCKCHGVSGSCELKTCWRTLPVFSEVGTVLRERFDSAIEVRVKEMGTRRELTTLDQHHKPHSDSDLVYLDDSPDFCEADTKRGSLGTHGRPCNKTSKGMDGCELMCCGRGYNTRRTVVTERCNCKFHWCCFVKCQDCQREVDEYVCR